MKCTNLGFIFIIFCGLPLIIATSQSESDNNLLVTLEHGGKLLGRELFSRSGRPIKAFLGIPFAKPPLGELRFKSPVAFRPWNDTRPADKFGNSCVQFRWGKITGSEDCLYINVYSPKNATEDSNLPVLVYIHGGGFFVNSASKYTGEYFLDHNIIFVTMNYRLGPLGFLSTETTDCPGNFGLKDQHLALEWVQTHISTFGGDPYNVTIFGESAGSISVDYHLSSPKSQGLFHKAILQSGTLNSPLWFLKDHGLAKERALKLADHLSCSNAEQNTTAIIECLRNVPAASIASAGVTLIKKPNLRLEFTPVLEIPHAEAFITENSFQKNYSIPVIIGFTADEGLLFTKSSYYNPFETLVENLPKFLNYENETEQFREKIDFVINNYYLNSNFSAQERSKNLTSLLGDYAFIFPTHCDLVHRFTDNQPLTKTYVYLFDHKHNFSKEKTGNFYGTAHEDDVFYLFPMEDEDYLKPMAGTDLELSRTLVNLWVNFATYGDPTPEGLGYPTWAHIDVNNGKLYNYMLIGNGRNVSNVELLQMNGGHYPLGKNKHEPFKELAFLYELNLPTPLTCKNGDRYLDF